MKRFVALAAIIPAFAAPGCSYDEILGQERIESGPITELATGLQGPSVLALDESHVYWLTQDQHDVESPDSVMKVPKSGGTPVVLVRGGPRPQRLVVDETHVYYTVRVEGNAGRVMRVPKDGGSSEVVVDGLFQPLELALDDDSVYYTSARPAEDPEVRWVTELRVISKTGTGEQTTIFETPGVLGGLRLAGDTIYASVMDLRGCPQGVDPGPESPCLMNPILAIPKDGGAHVLVTESQQVTAASFGYALPVDDARIYWTSVDGPATQAHPDIERMFVKAMPVAGGAEEVLYSHAGELEFPAVGHGRFYVPAFLDGDVIEISTDGTEHRILASDREGPLSIAVDDNAIYWTELIGGNVVKLDRPSVD